MKIAVFGAGYVGLVAGTCFADSGHDVIIVDVDAKRVAALTDGKIPIYEPGLEELVKRSVAEDRLTFSTDAGGAVRAAEVIFVAVGTPPDAEGRADLSAVLAVARTIGANLNGYKVIVDKSTVPVGTADKVRAEIQAHAPKGAQFEVVSNPEFLKEGAAIDDFMKPDRVVIGCESDRARAIMTDLYGPFVRTNKPILFMDVRSAELTKYAANAMLAARISFMNEIARLCELLGANVEHVRKGIGTDSRIGFPFLFPGPGYGGSCFPKDVQALIQTSQDAGYQLKIARAIEDVNADQKHRLAEKVIAKFGPKLQGKVFCIWGLAFKPNTDDIREAPALVVIEDLLARGATIHVTDPEAIETTRRVVGDRVKYFDKNYDALAGADALLLVTEWNEYRRPNFGQIKEKLRQAVIFDGRNVYDRKTLEALGFEYHGIGM